MRTTVLLAALLLVAPAAAQAKKEALAERVKRSIDKSIEYLRANQRANGSFETDLAAANIHGGWTALASLALLNAGVSPKDPAMTKSLEFLRKLDTSSVYVKSLQTMVFVEARQPEDKLRIGENIAWLIKARVLKDGKLAGWSYDDKIAIVTDNSNTQYALLGLHYGSQAGVAIKREIWESIRDYYLTTQKEDGGWVYSAKTLDGGLGATSMTMTAAGLCGLFIAGMELAVPCASTGVPGKTRACGEYADNAALARAKSWISTRFTIDLPQRVFYHIYGLERTGRLSGERFFGPYDWYREGCQWLIDRQKPDGHFEARGTWDQWPVVSTSFALLFLSKGQTPVLVSKMVHGPWPRRGDDLDWNNDRNDLRHLVNFTSKHIFKDLPLAWQTFDIRQAAGAISGAREITDDDIAEVTSELLQSPILYINGHRSPLGRISPIERKVLKRFVESGGFIVVEACCGSKEFDAGFKKLVQEEDMWPDNDLSELDSGHPVWKSDEFLIKPGDPYKLYGISMGCKTVLIYSPQDMSCFWESNLLTDGKGVQAFRLGANIIAYATGKEPPKPRLTEVEIARGKDPAVIPRGYLKVAQIKHKGYWRPAPNAMSNLMDHVSKYAGLRVALKTDLKAVNDEELLRYKFLYMHGKAAFSFAPEDLERLRFNLENGALLFADACCGSPEFDKSFRAFAKELFPKAELQRVPEDDVVFSKRLSGVDLDATTIQGRTKSGAEPKSMSPHLEGVRIDGRWVVLYSKYDIGCALERASAGDCLGYTPESAFKIATAAVLYTFWPSAKE